MQQTDPQAPGYFIVPAKLLQAQMDSDADESSPRLGRGDALQDELLEDEFSQAQQDLLLGGENEFENDPDQLPDVLCQRCFSLRHAGKIKVEAAESQLPEFDLGKKVGKKIFLQKDRRAVVLLVVDAWDFDGSLPRAALKSLYPPGYDFSQQPSREPAVGDDGLPDASLPNMPPPVKFKLMVALNKVDLLPKEATAIRLTNWVRTRMNQAGLPKPDKVFCISANKGSGVRDMVDTIKTALGFRGDLWVVGAQNAGKSSVIAAMKRLGGTTGQRDPTIAPVAGTTLGLINVPGLPLGPKQRCFDTPGVAHDHQLTSFLNIEEVKQVLPGKALHGRTFRTSAGHSILLGGLGRIDVLEHPGGTLYLTVFVSSAMNLHLGKTEGAAERLAKGVGGLLVPPASSERFQELPPWVTRTVTVEGTTWDKSTVDIAIAGLGWIAIGVKGTAKLGVCVAPQVQVTTRPALVPDYAKDFCRPGFSIMLPASKQQQAARSAHGSKQQQQSSASSKGSGSGKDSGKGRAVAGVGSK